MREAGALEELTGQESKSCPNNVRLGNKRRVKKSKVSGLDGARAAEFIFFSNYFWLITESAFLFRYYNILQDFCHYGGAII